MRSLKVMNTTKTRLAWALALTLGGTVTASANTVELFDSIYDPITGEKLPGTGSSGIGNGEMYGQEFGTTTECPVGCLLGTVSLVLNAGDEDLENTSGFKVEIFTSVPGASTREPGTLVATLDNPDSIPSAGSFPSEFTPQAPTVLTDNTNYWVKLTGLSSGLGDLAWEWPNGALSDSPFHYLEDGVFGDGNGYAMQVEASPVPVPAAFWLMGTALAGLAARAKKKTA